MAISLTQNDYNVMKQSIRNISIKVNLLNYSFQTVDSLEGYLISGDLSIDANADIRRTCNLSLVVNDSTFNIYPGSKIWLDKYIQIYQGVESLISGEVSWINLGIYIINNPSRVYNATTNTLSFQAVDLMAKLTGMRNGYVNGITTVIPQGSNIREVIISTLNQMTSFKKYIVEDNPQVVPYELKFEKGSTVYDILSKLRDISPNYEIFFDVDGVFHYQLIPSGVGSPVIVDNDILDRVTIDASVNTSFEDVKNTIEVWGHAHEPNVFVDNVLLSETTYSGTATGISEYTPWYTIGFVSPQDVISGTPYFKINELEPLPIKNEDGTDAIMDRGEGYYYILQVNEDSAYFIMLGGQQIAGFAQDNNPDSPFYVNGTTGTIRIVLSGGEYENIWSDNLASQRAEYELYLRDRLSDSLDIKCLPIYWMDVNVKIEYINEKLGLTNKLWNVQTQSYDLPSHFLVKKISMGLGYDGTMTMNCCRFYPLYPFL